MMAILLGRQVLADQIQDALQLLGLKPLVTVLDDLQVGSGRLSLCRLLAPV